MPVRKTDKLSSDERNQIATHLVTRFSVTATQGSSSCPAQRAFVPKRPDVLKVLPPLVTLWGKFRIDGGGDTIHAFHTGKRPQDTRDATYVKVCGSWVMIS